MQHSVWNPDTQTKANFSFQKGLGKYEFIMEATPKKEYWNGVWLSGPMNQHFNGDIPMKDEHGKDKDELFVEVNTD